MDDEYSSGRDSDRTVIDGRELELEVGRLRERVRELERSESTLRSMLQRAPGLNAERKRQEWLRLLLERVPAVIWTTDGELRLTSGGGDSLERLQVDSSEPLGSLYDYFGTRDDNHASIDAHLRALGGESVRFRTEWMARSFDAHVEPLLDAEGTPVGTIGVALDITEQRRLEDELRQAQKMEALGQLAGGVAHDFNNLLTAIKGNAEVLSRRLRDAELAPLVGEIRKAGDRAATLTRQLLAFGRRQLLEPRPIDPIDVVRDTEQMVAPLLGENVTLELDLTDPSGTVHADPAALQQVLVNLAVNAREAMPEGGKVTVRCRPSQRGEAVEIEVHDTGVGMDAVTRARVFEPFFTTKSRGTGLGLSTAYGIVAQSGGEMDVRSAIGRGTCFSIRLPRVELEPGAWNEPPEPLDMPAGDERVLLVEDDGLVRRLASRILQAAGYSVLEAGDGEEALALCREQPVDLVLTDVMMPGMGGAELVRRLEPLCPGVAVLYMSGHPTSTDGEPPLQPLLAKPFTPSSLAREIRRLLDARVTGAAG